MSVESAVEPCEAIFSDVVVKKRSWFCVSMDTLVFDREYRRIEWNSVKAGR